MRTPFLTAGLRIGLVAAILWVPASADARPRKSSVNITTRPAGAVITMETGEILGSTPLRTSLPRGTHILMITKEGFEPLEYAIEVTRRKRKNRFRIALDPIVAIDVVLGDDSINGAEIYVDGEKVGTAPSMIELERGEHQIEIRKQGYMTYEEFVELEGLHEIEASLEPLTIDGPPSEKVITAGDDETSGDAAPLVHIGGGLELGGRRFRYSNPQTINMRDFDAGGVPVVRVTADVFPLAHMRHKLLSGLNVTGTMGRAAPVNSNTSEGEVVGTGFGDMELGLGWRIPMGRPTLAGEGWDIGGQVAYGRQFFSFERENPLAVEVPDVDYKFVRLGAGVGSTFNGRYRAYGMASYRAVSSTGLLGDRFQSDSASGIGVAGGMSARVRDSVELRITANAVRYGHSFGFEDGAEFAADGASDSFFGLLVGALYVY